MTPGFSEVVMTEADMKHWLHDLEYRMPAGIHLEGAVIRGGIQHGAWEKQTWLTRLLVRFAWWILRKDSFVVIRYKDE